MSGHRDRRRALALGRWGEDQVCRQLEKAGFAIRARNFRRRGCEIDLIAARDRELIFVEVRTRSRPPADPAGLMNRQKFFYLQRGVQHYLSTQTERFPDQIRIALAVVIGDGAEGKPGPGIRWYEDLRAEDLQG